MAYKPSRVKFVLLVANCLLGVSLAPHCTDVVVWLLTWTLGMAYALYSTVLRAPVSSQVLTFGLIAYAVLLYLELPFHDAWNVVITGASRVSQSHDLPLMQTRALAVALLLVGVANFAVGTAAIDVCF